jgi:hypothetical protein
MRCKCCAARITSIPPVVFTSWVASILCWGDIQAATQLIALSGDLQSGAAARLQNITQASLSDSGHIAFHATLQHGIGGVSAGNDRAVWRVSGGTRHLVAWGGVTAAPGGGVLDQFQFVSVGENGDVVVRGTTISGSQGIWRFPSAGGAAVIASTNAVGVPGDPNAMFAALPPNPLHAGDGRVAYNGSLAHDGFVTADNDRGVWLDDGTAGSLLVREYFSPVPSIAGGRYSVPIVQAVNDVGEVALTASLVQGIVGVTLPTSFGLWRYDSSGGELVVRSGVSEVPGVPGTTFSILENVTMNNNARIAASGELTLEGAVTEANRRGIWLYDGIDGRLVARAGSQSTSLPGAVFASFGAPLLNNSNDILVAGTLAPGAGGVTSATAEGLWKFSADGETLLARTGVGGAPGVAGASFANFTSLAVNDAGFTAVSATLSIGAGGVTAANDEGIWLLSEGAGILVAREGDTLAGRVIEDLEFTAGSGGSDGRPLGFNSSSQLLFKATFTNGDEGLFLFTPGSSSTADFTLDGSVNGADLIRWRSNFGQLGAAQSRGDADGDADVDGADLLIWQRQIGVVGLTSAVPEPSPDSMLLATCLAGALLLKGSNLPRVNSGLAAARRC